MLLVMLLLIAKRHLIIFLVGIRFKEKENKILIEPILMLTENGATSHFNHENKAILKV